MSSVDSAGDGRDLPCLPRQLSLCGLRRGGVADGLYGAASLRHLPRASMPGSLVQPDPQRDGRR